MIRVEVSFTKDDLVEVALLRGKTNASSVTLSGVVFEAGTVQYVRLVAVHEGGRFNGHLEFTEAPPDNDFEKTDLKGMPGIRRSSPKPKVEKKAAKTTPPKTTTPEGE